MNDPNESDVVQNSIDFDEMLPKKTHSHVYGALLSLSSYAAMIAIVVFSSLEVFGNTISSSPWVFLLLLGWLLVGKIVKEMISPFDRSTDIQLRMIKGYYEFMKYDELMDRYFGFRFREKGWSNSEPPELVDHLDEIMTTSRIAANRTREGYRKSGEFSRWIMGAGTCIDLMPYDYARRATAEIKRDDEKALLEDWSAAFGPLASALKTRELELKRWETTR